MAGFRAIRDKARAALHEALQVPALYLPVGWTPDDDHLLVNVRVHTSFNALGEVAGTSFRYAERQEVTPKIVFLRTQVALPQVNAIVSVAEGEAYRVTNSMPPDNATIMAEVIPLSAAQANGLPIPPPPTV